VLRTALRSSLDLAGELSKCIEADLGSELVGSIANVARSGARLVL
jgi:hypothetical protein